MTRRIVTLVAVFLALAALTTACSDDNTVHTAKIGVIAPLDGGLVEFGRGIRNSVQLAVDQANRRRALPHWRFAVEAVDDSSDPAKGEAAARRLAADPDVIGVVGTYNSGVAAKAAPVLNGADIVMVSPANTDTTLTRGSDPAHPARPYPNYFRMVAADVVQGPFLANEAAATGARRAAVVSESKPVSKGLADNFAAAFEADGGTIAYTKVVPDGTTDFAGVAAELAPTGPDLVFFGGEYKIGATFTKQLTDAGVGVPVMGGDGIKDDAYITEAGPASDNDLASTVGAPLASLDSAKAYVDSYTAAKYAQPPSEYGVYAFDAANVVITPAEKVLAGKSSVTRQVRADVIAAVQDTDMPGASGQLGFDEFGDTRTRVLTLWRVSEGAWKPVTTETVPTGS